MAKKIREYRLPHSDKYYLLDITRGSVIDGMGSCCDNCGALISNIAHIKNENNQHFYVGMDCAETLSSLKDSEDFESAKYHMREANKIIKAYRDGIDFEASVSNDGIPWAYFNWKENKETKSGMKYIKQNGSGLVMNNTLSLLPQSFKEKFNIKASWI
jgi:hypothetical protein